MLKGYEEYTSYNLPHLQHVPSHWSVLKNTSIFSEIVDTNHPNLPLLSITKENGIVIQKSTGRKKRMSLDNINYKRIQPNDIGYNLMNAFMGSIGASKYEGIISPAYAVCRPKIPINTRYYHYLFRTPYYQTEFDRHSYGIMYERNRLYFQRFKQISSPFPSLDEQNQIVRYLDAKVAKINRLISAKKKEIALLKEYKQAIITRAVTKGIRAGVPMKESGVEWIGEIPEGWGVSPLKYTTTCNNQVLSEQTDEDTQINYIDIGSVNSDGNILNVQNLSFKEAPSRARRIVSENDTIISTVRTYLKAIAFIPKSYDNFIVSTGFAVLTPQKQYNPRYFYYALRVDWFISLIESNSVGISYPAINSEKLISLPNIVPPLPEQQEIADYLDAKCSAIDATIQKRELAIEKLTEYKLSLIYECVTGKVDVRGIHVEEVPEAELIEEFDEEIVDEFDDETSEEENIE